MSESQGSSTSPPASASSGGAPPAAGLASEASKEKRTWAMLAHILGIVTWIIGPLVIWQLKKQEDAFIADQGKEALNFQITMTILYVACFVLSFIPVLGSIVWLAAWVVSLVLCIMAGLKANEGVAHRYPFALRLVK